MARDAKGPRLKRSIWRGVIERQYVAQQIALHMNEVVRALVGLSIDDDFLAREIFLNLTAIDLLGRCVHSDDSGEFVTCTVHCSIQLEEIHRMAQS